MNRFSFKIAPVKCDYCAFIASSIYELRDHSCHRRFRLQNMAQRSPKINKPNVMKKTPNLRNVYDEFKPLVKPLQFEQPSWNEIEDISDIPVPVLELENRNDLRNLMTRRPRNHDDFAPRPAMIHQEFPPYHMKRVPLPILVNHSLGKSNTDNYFDRPNVNITSSSELVSEIFSQPTHVITISPETKEIIILSLDEVIRVLEKQIEEFPYVIKLQLEYEFLQHVQNAVDEEEKRTSNAV